MSHRWYNEQQLKQITVHICFEKTQMSALSIFICVVALMYIFIRDQDIH